MPEDTPEYFNILGIDPGTMKLGIAIITVNRHTLEIISSTATTFNADKMLPRNSWMAEVYGERAARIAELEEAIYEWLLFYRPSDVVSESPFFNSTRPMAYGALVEILSAVRRAVQRYCNWMALHLISPSEVKNAVGAKGDGNKDAVQKRILAMTSLNYVGLGGLEALDNNGIDGLAVAFSRYTAIKEFVCSLLKPIAGRY